MNTHQEHLYKLACIGLGVCMLCVTCASSLGLVWMRQRTSQAADNIKTLERELAVFTRKNTYLASKIAQVESPERLARHVSGRLAAPGTRQVVWMAPLPFAPERSVARAEPIVASYDLAFLENTTWNR